MAKYEIVKYNLTEMGEESRATATADDPIGVISEAFRLFREAGGEIRYDFAKSDEWCITSRGMLRKPKDITIREVLTLTPPQPKTPMQEWKRRRPVCPNPATYSSLQVYDCAWTKWAEKNCRWLLEMPEGLSK